ncbi:MAG: hypothetical protein K2Z81_19480 [Cyanobacteria bacterium]|nr:hypothetical protein [Cyanobacteriota bacterium]
MPGHEDISRLLRNLSESANGTKQRERGCTHYASDNLHQYKTNQAWPGRKYKLIGNSFAIEQRIIDSSYKTRRTASIAMALEKGRDNRNCVSIEDALQMPGFVESLSRFEYDWLTRQPSSTLVGPAYDDRGRLIPESFAVWRRTEIKTHKRERELAAR